MTQTPGFVIPSFFSSEEDLQRDLDRRSRSAGFTAIDFSMADDPITHNEETSMSNEVDDFLEHYGVKGMKWGVRKSSDGIPRKTHREAQKDAKEYARAKMYYGEGAGVRRRLINNTVQSKSKDPAYKQAFDQAVGGQDMAKRASEARSERKKTNVKNSTKKTVRGVGHVVRGNSQYASLAAVALAGAGGLAYRNGGDKILRDVGNRAASTIKDTQSLYRAKQAVKNMGL